MKNTRKSAFILSECNSPYIAQAIFILREGVLPEECGVLADAERIVASYMSDAPRRNTPKKALPHPAFFALSAGMILLSVLAVCAYFLI